MTVRVIKNLISMILRLYQISWVKIMSGLKKKFNYKDQFMESQI
jgi:hypothetical protein